MKRKTALTILFVATVVLVIAAVVGFLPAVMTPMMFDAPGSLENPATVTLAISVATFPIVCVLAIVLSWLVALLPPHNYAWACGLTTLPLMNIAVATLAVVWLSIFNGGSFS